jgi:hypothetical protein
MNSKQGFSFFLMNIIVFKLTALGAVKFWVLGLALSCLLGIVIGIATRPYVIPHVISYFCSYCVLQD